MTQGILINNARILGSTGHVESDQSLVIADDGIIQWCGADKDRPAKYSSANYVSFDAQGKLLTPGLIDCHTHLVYGGNRSNEFRMRLEGKSYAQIAAAGGGIRATVAATRMASEEELIAASLPRLLALRAEGVTTVEIKSGYGLDLQTEMKMLRVARQLGEMSGQRVITTFLGAHALPEEYLGRQQAYVDYLCKEMMPAVAEAGLADAVDVFCEHIAFDLTQTEQILQRAIELGLPFKCHAEQLSNMGATASAAGLGALSCEHLEYLDDIGIEAMRKNGTVAVLLPGAYYYLAETRVPPIQALRENNIPIAVATDANPGSSPTASLLLMLSMACRFFALTVDEALAAVTKNAARALGLADTLGSITPGMTADLVLWSIADPAELCYYFASPLTHRTMIKGEWLD